jgi:hypothetical protein
MMSLRSSNYLKNRIKNGIFQQAQKVVYSFSASRSHAPAWECIPYPPEPFGGRWSMGTRQPENPKFELRNPKQIRNSNYEIWLLVAGCSLLVSRCSLLVSRCSLLVSRYWLLVAV